MCAASRRAGFVHLGGLLIWAAHFCLVYAANAFACERRWATALAGVSRCSRRRGRRAAPAVHSWRHAWRRREEPAGEAGAHFMLARRRRRPLAALAVGWQSRDRPDIRPAPKRLCRRSLGTVALGATRLLHRGGGGGLGCGLAARAPRRHHRTAHRHGPGLRGLLLLGGVTSLPEVAVSTTSALTGET